MRNINGIARFYAGLVFFIIVSLTFFSCSEKKTAPNPNPPSPSNIDNSAAVSVKNETENSIEEFWSGIFDGTGLPGAIRERIIARVLEGPDFTMELLSLINGDPWLYKLVDKQHALDRDYVPEDLVECEAGSFRVTRQIILRAAAAESLELMAAASKAQGVTLTAASAYRSYDYQAGVYSRNVREMGQAAADRESAPPGNSQHQLGQVLDFYPIDDEFAETAASRWLLENADSFGWSLSFPQGYEEVTGFRWESWHYRYVGPELAGFINKYFDGIQQYALVFIDAWINASR